MKGTIIKVGTITEDGRISGWLFKGGDAGVEFNPTRYAGWTVDELREIVKLQKEHDDKVCRGESQSVNDGGPAFPTRVAQPFGDGYLEVGGMTLRDWFASQASDEDIADMVPATQGACAAFHQAHGFWPTRQWARYNHADEMMRARLQTREAKP